VATSIASPAIFVAAPAETAASAIAAILASPARNTIAEAPVSSSDRLRTWLWSSLTIIAASQLYFFHELLAAFALFAIAFAALALVIISLHMLVKCCELAIARLVNLRQPSLHISRVPRDSHKLA